MSIFSAKNISVCSADILMVYIFQVHSLSTVISFKMEFEQKTAASDQDGLKYADRVNQYLPNTIRVFGIVPVNKLVALCNSVFAL
jgi:hypothetical protein